MPVKEFLQRQDVKGLNGDGEPDYVGPARVLMHLRSFIVRFIVNYTVRVLARQVSVIAAVSAQRPLERCHCDVFSGTREQ